MTEEQTRGPQPGKLRVLNTAAPAGVHTGLTADDQRYLDLWRLRRKRASWCRTKQRAEHMIQTIDRALVKIERPEEAVSGDEPGQVGARPSAGPGTDTCLRVQPSG